MDSKNNEAGEWARVAAVHEHHAQAVAEGREASAAWVLAGEAWERVEGATGAMRCYQRAFEAEPGGEAARAALKRARRLYARDGEWELVAELLALEIETGAARDSVVARWIELGEVAREHLGDGERAVACFEAALRLEPSNETAREKLGTLWGTQGVAVADGAALVVQADAVTDNELAALLYFQAGREFARALPEDVRAETAFRKALARVPGHPAALDALRGWYERNARWADVAGLAAPVEARPAAVPSKGAGVTRTATIRTVVESRRERGNAEGTSREAFESLEPGSEERVLAVRQRAKNHRAAGEWRALRDLLCDEIDALTVLPRGAAARDEIVEWLIALADLYAGPLKDEGFEIAMLERACAIEPQNAGALARLAVRYADLGRVRDEFRVLKRMTAIEGATHSARVLRRIADLAEGALDDCDEAILALETLCAILPADRRAEERLLKVLRKAGLWDRVVEIVLERFERGLVERDELRAVALEAGEHGLREGLEARIWATLLELDAKDADAFERLVAIDLRANRFAGAVERLLARAKATKESGPRATFLSRAGAILLDRLGRRDEAEAVFGECFEIAPEDGPAFRALVGMAWSRADAARAAALFERRGDREGFLAELDRVVRVDRRERTRVAAALELARRWPSAAGAALTVVWTSREANASERAEAARGLAGVFRAEREPGEWAAFVAESIPALPLDEAAERLTEIAHACDGNPALQPILVGALDRFPPEAARALGARAVDVVLSIAARVRGRANVNAVVSWIDDAIAALHGDPAHGATRAALEEARAHSLLAGAGRDDEALLALERLFEMAALGHADDVGIRLEAWVQAARRVGDARALVRALEAKVAHSPATEVCGTLRTLAELWETELRGAPEAAERRTETYRQLLAREPGDAVAALKLADQLAQAGDADAATATLEHALAHAGADEPRKTLAAALFSRLALAGDWDSANRVVEGLFAHDDGIATAYRVVAEALAVKARPAVARHYVERARSIGWSRVPSQVLAELYAAARVALRDDEPEGVLATLLREERAIHRELLGDLVGAFEIGLGLARLTLDASLLDALVSEADRLARWADVAAVAEESLMRQSVTDVVAVHRVLAGLYESRLRDPAGAIRHRRAVIAAAGDDWASWAALARLAEGTEAWAELREILRHLTGLDAARGGASPTGHPDIDRAHTLERLLAIELDILRDGASALETARALADAVPDHFGAWRTIARLVGESPETEALLSLRVTALRRLRVLEAGLPADARVHTLLGLGRALAASRATANEAALALSEAARIVGRCDDVRDVLEALLRDGFLEGAAERAALETCGHLTALAEKLEVDAEAASSVDRPAILERLAQIYATSVERPDKLRRALRRLVLLAPRDAGLRARYRQVVEETGAWDEFKATLAEAAAVLKDDDEEVWEIMVDVLLIASRESAESHDARAAFAAIVERARSVFARDGAPPVAAQQALLKALEGAVPSEARVEAVNLLAESFVRANEPKRAAEVLQRAIEHAANEREAAGWLDRLALLCATRLDQADAAASLFVDAGDLWAALSEPELARVAYERAIPLASGEALAKIHIALANTLRGEPSRALDAVDHYDAALDLLARVDSRPPFSQPDDLVAFRRIDEILTARRDWKPLERAYRHMIARVASTRFKPLLVLLWRNLGEIYRSRLGDPARAAQAFEVVVDLAPDDEAAKKLLDALRLKKP